jgi:hypothetical protein
MGKPLLDDLDSKENINSIKRYLESKGYSWSLILILKIIFFPVFITFVFLYAGILPKFVEYLFYFFLVFMSLLMVVEVTVYLSYLTYLADEEVRMVFRKNMDIKILELKTIKKIKVFPVYGSFNFVLFSLSGGRKELICINSEDKEVQGFFTGLKNKINK